jgi:hypothetical protein
MFPQMFMYDVLTYLLLASAVLPQTDYTFLERDDLRKSNIQGVS